MAQQPQQPQQLLILTGPECCGKSTLAEHIASRLGVPLVLEQARAYLQQLESSGGSSASNYTEQDVLNIAAAQDAAETQALASGAAVVVADTDLQIIKLWWREKYGELPKQWHGMPPSHQAPKRTYLLCYPDLVWEPDALRENPFDRDRLFRAQLKMLESDGAVFRVIWGQGRFRERLAWQYVKTLLDQ